MRQARRQYEVASNAAVVRICFWHSFRVAAGRRAGHEQKQQGRGVHFAPLSAGSGPISRSKWGQAA